MPRVLSCIQPTGAVHLGNFLGAIRQWADDADPENSFHGIVDLHALTIPRDPAELRRRTTEVAGVLFASGLTPDRAVVFAQSRVPEHTELGWLMECTASFGELSRMTQFKDKSSKQGDGFISAGLLTYPALMAADILLYDTDIVPVGDDQRQHLEITRDLASRFNHRYGPTFTVPEAGIPKIGARVMDLQDPSSKMSSSAESDAGRVDILDDPKTIERKIKRAVTDVDNEVRFDTEAKPGVSNLLSILAACTGADPAKLADKYQQYGPLKTDVAAAVIETVAPIQRRYAEIVGDPAELARLLDAGAQRARRVAAATMERARVAVGLR